MRNLFKKSLAMCLAIALCLTAMVGLTVSAEDATITGTITASGAEVEAGATTATVSFTLAATDLSEVILSLEASEGATISGVAAPEGTTAYAVIPNADKSMVAFSTADVSVVTSEATVNVTVTFAEAVAEDAYAVTATLGTGMGATNKEELIIISDPAVANITVKTAEAPHVHTKGELISATPAVQDGEDGEIVFDCTTCDENIVEDVKYEDAVSVYGMEAFVESEIMIKYNAGLQYFPAGYDAESVILSVETSNSNTGVPEIEYIQSADSYIESNKFYWEAGVAAYQMTENMKVTVYIKINDVWCSGWQADVTFTSYAKILLNNSGTASTVKTVIVDLLNFGTAVQTLNNYNVESLANAEFDAYQSLGSDTSVSPDATSDVVFNIDYSAPIYHESYQLVADSRVETQIKLNIADDYVDTAVYVANYTDGDSVEHNIAYVVDEAALATLSNVEFDKVYIMDVASAGKYYASFAEFAAYEAETNVTFTLYSNGVAGETLSLSVKGATAYTRNTYSSSPNHVAVFDALIRYFDSSEIAFS